MSEDFDPEDDGWDDTDAVCECGHVWDEHSDRGCEVQWIENHFTGEWVDCPCRMFDEAMR